PPDRNARLTPASTTNVVAARPPATTCTTLGRPSSSRESKTCVAAIPTSASPRATSTPTTRGRGAGARPPSSGGGTVRSSGTGTAVDTGATLRTGLPARTGRPHPGCQCPGADNPGRSGARGRGGGPHRGVGVAPVDLGGAPPPPDVSAPSPDRVGAATLLGTAPALGPAARREGGAAGRLHRTSGGSPNASHHRPAGLQHRRPVRRPALDGRVLAVPQ